MPDRINDLGSWRRYWTHKAFKLQCMYFYYLLESVVLACDHIIYGFFSFSFFPLVLCLHNEINCQKKNVGFKVHLVLSFALEQCEDLWWLLKPMQDPCHLVLKWSILPKVSTWSRWTYETCSSLFCFTLPSFVLAFVSLFFLNIDMTLQLALVISK